MAEVPKKYRDWPTILIGWALVLASVAVAWGTLQTRQDVNTQAIERLRVEKASKEVVVEINKRLERIDKNVDELMRRE